MSKKCELDKQNAEYPWTARQKRAKVGRGAAKRDRKLKAAQRSKAR